MKLLYAPWRENYHGSEKKGCVFCLQSSEADDKKNYIIKRYDYCFVMLNLYPYNAGHVLIVPYKHAPTLDALDNAIRAELIEIISLSSSVICKALAAEGLNMGTNQGKAAGGSIPDHIHIHVLPRWIGDTNFLAAFAATKPISFDLQSVYEKLVKAFESA